MRIKRETPTYPAVFMDGPRYLLLGDDNRFSLPWQGWVCIRHRRKLSLGPHSIATVLTAAVACDAQL